MAHMTPRADEPPRRGREPRRSGIGAARAYTPRGRTVAERLAEGDRPRPAPPRDRPRVPPPPKPRIPQQRRRRIARPLGPPPPLANSTRRIRLSTLAALVAFIGIGIRLVVLQVV